MIRICLLSLVMVFGFCSFAEAQLFKGRLFNRGASACDSAGASCAVATVAQSTPKKAEPIPAPKTTAAPEAVVEGRIRIVERIRNIHLFNGGLRGRIGLCKR